MKPLSASKALLLAAFLGTLPRIASGVPVSETREITESRLIPRVSDFSVVLGEPVDGKSITSREEDDELSPGQSEDPRAKGIVVRIDLPKIPKPPPPPPPPLPRPVPVVPKPKVPAPKPKPPPRPITPPRPPPPKPDPDAKPIPDTEKPGKGPGLGDDPKSMDVYQDAGVRQLDRYKGIVESGRADTLIVGTEADLAGHAPNTAFLDLRQIEGYEVDDAIDKLEDSPIKEITDFRSDELGFNIKSTGFVQQVLITKKDQHNLEINRGTYDKKGNFMAYQDAFKDNNNPDGGKKIPLNEMNMQNFIAVAGDNTRNLKAVFLMNIQNKEFWAITRQNYNDMKQPFTQVLTFESGTAQFNRFMGSPNLNSKFYAFANHHNAIGNKIPEKIIVVPKQVEGSSGNLVAVVVFKES